MVILLLSLKPLSLKLIFVKQHFVFRQITFAFYRNVSSDKIHLPSVSSTLHLVRRAAVFRNYLRNYLTRNKVGGMRTRQFLESKSRPRDFGGFCCFNPLKQT